MLGRCCQIVARNLRKDCATPGVDQQAKIAANKKAGTSLFPQRGLYESLQCNQILPYGT